MKYVNADFVGCLVLIEVDVFKVANISPKLLIATYECDICHNHSYKTVSTLFNSLMLFNSLIVVR